MAKGLNAGVECARASAGEGWVPAVEFAGWIEGVLDAEEFHVAIEKQIVRLAFVDRIAQRVFGGLHARPASITTIQSQFIAWSGGALFDADANGDGVSNGLAFLLGAAGPGAAVMVPTVTQSDGSLVLSNFSCRNLASRGTATISSSEAASGKLFGPPQGDEPVSVATR